MASSENQIYLRIKRRNQTFCFLCHRDDKIESIHEKVAACLEEHPLDQKDAPGKMRLLASDQDQTVLEPSKTISSYENEIKDNAVLNLVFAINEDEYETGESADLQDSG